MLKIEAAEAIIDLWEPVSGPVDLALASKESPNASPKEALAHLVQVIKKVFCHLGHSEQVDRLGCKHRFGELGAPCLC